jgi:hypothetical protein
MTMKRILTALALACAAVSSFGATLNPVQLLNPAGSSSGQAIISTGASTAPAWGNVLVANVTGAAALTGATFTGPLLASYANPTFIVNDTSGSGFASMALESSGTVVWQLVKQASQNFVLQRWVSGSSVDNPISVSNSTGAVTMVDGITNTPLSATTISASGLITPASAIGIKGTTAGDTSQAGSIGETMSATFTSVNITTTNVAQSLASINLTAGDWDVTGYVTFVSGSGATMTIWVAGLNTANNTLPAVGNYFESIGSVGSGLSATAVAPVSRQNVTGNTTVFLVGEAVFGGGSVSATGFLRARRMR